MTSNPSNGFAARVFPLASVAVVSSGGKQFYVIPVAGVDVVRLPQPSVTFVGSSSLPKVPSEVTMRAHYSRAQGVPGEETGFVDQDGTPIHIGDVIRPINDDGNQGIHWTGSCLRAGAAIVRGFDSNGDIWVVFLDSDGDDETDYGDCSGCKVLRPYNNGGGNSPNVRLVPQESALVAVHQNGDRFLVVS